MKTLFQCEICGQSYPAEYRARECEAEGLETAGFQVGDIVVAGNDRRFGWFDGDSKWLFSDTPGDPSARDHFDRDRAFGFFYVIGSITGEGHRATFHLFTRAMKEQYASGTTYLTGHFSMRKVEAPDDVKKEAQEFIGKRAKWLL